MKHLCVDSEDLWGVQMRGVGSNRIPEGLLGSGPSFSDAPFAFTLF